MQPLYLLDSGGASSPHATITGGPWVHAPPRENLRKARGSSTTSSFLPFLAGGDLQNKKNTSKFSDSLFF
jgi:hypothetical protein